MSALVSNVNSRVEFKGIAGVSTDPTISIGASSCVKQFFWILAAILNVKLDFLEQWLKERRLIAYKYSKELSGIDDLVTPNEISSVYCVYNQ